MKTDKWLVPAIILLSISIAISGLFVGRSISALAESKSQVASVQKGNEDILSFSEATAYLEISDEKLQFIVDNSKYVDGNGIPYYKIDNNIMFSKTALSKWIVYSSENRLDY